MYLPTIVMTAARNPSNRCGRLDTLTVLGPRRQQFEKNGLVGGTVPFQKFGQDFVNRNVQALKCAGPRNARRSSTCISSAHSRCNGGAALALGTRSRTI